MPKEHKMNLQTLENFSLKPLQIRGRRVNANYERMAENCAFPANGLENTPTQMLISRTVGKTFLDSATPTTTEQEQG